MTLLMILIQKKRENESQSVLMELISIQPIKAVSIKDLQIGLEYKILSAKKLNTKYGDQIMVQLEENVTFLPKRYNKISKETLDALNRGKYGMKVKEVVGKTYDIEFMLKDDSEIVDYNSEEELFIQHFYNK